MSTMQNTKRTVAVMRPVKVCDHCGGPFGMVTYRWWGGKFCKRRCKDAYLHEIMLGRDVIRRWRNSGSDQRHRGHGAYALLWARAGR